MLEDGDGIDHVQVMSGVNGRGIQNGSTSEQQILRQFQHSLPKYRQVPQSLIICEQYVSYCSIV